MSDFPDDVWAAAKHAFVEARVMSIFDTQVSVIARAILAERERWKPAVTYFERYCQDEADDEAVEFVGCSEQQHEDAKAFRDAIPEKKHG